MCPAHSCQSREACVSPSGERRRISRRRWRSTPTRASGGGELRRRHPRWHRAHALQPELPLSHRTRPAGSQARRRAPGQRRGARVAALVLPLEQHPGRSACSIWRVAGQLRQPGVLAAEVRRMIADKRADALVSNFAGQWLQLRNLESKVAAGHPRLPGLRRQHPRRLPPRNRTALLAHRPREPQRAWSC